MFYENNDLINKNIINDILNKYNNELNNLYNLNENQLINKNIMKKYIKFDYKNDNDTIKFLYYSIKNAGGFKDIVGSLYKKIFNMNQTDVNGTLNRGKMFIFSKKQLSKLLLIENILQDDNNENNNHQNNVENNKILLDIGAGNGFITNIIAETCNINNKNVYATEVSKPMLKLLKNRGYNALGPDLSKLDLTDEKIYKKNSFDYIACLNLLDRADKPVTILNNIKKLLKPKIGKLILAINLPYCAFVENIDGTQGQPSENFDKYMLKNKGRCIDGSSFENSLSCFINALEDLGFNIETFTKIGYLCEGDQNNPFYSLADAVFILSV